MFGGIIIDIINRMAITIHARTKRFDMRQTTFNLFRLRYMEPRIP